METLLVKSTHLPLRVIDRKLTCADPEMFDQNTRLVVALRPSPVFPRLYLRWAWKRFLVLVVHQLDRVTKCHQLRSPQPLALLQSDAWIVQLPVNLNSARRVRTSPSRPRPPAFPGEPSSLRRVWSDGDFFSLGDREILMNVLPIQLLLENRSIDAHFLLLLATPDLCTSAAWKLTPKPRAW